MLAALPALGACSMPDFDSMRAPDPSSLFRPLSVTGVRETNLRPVTQEDLVDDSGRCAAMGTQPGDVPMIPAVIGLDMTECEVVKRAGPPERVQIGANERGERTAVLTYVRGERPGIYNFIGGRLASMERGPEPPPAAAKPTRRAPKPRPS